MTGCSVPGSGGVSVSWYLTVCSDERYTAFTDTSRALELLSGFSELRPTGAMSFSSVQPWVSVQLHACDSSGNYASDGSFIARINLVELVCSYDAGPDWCERLAARIADALGWKVFENDDQRQIHPPAQMF